MALGKKTEQIAISFKEGTTNEELPRLLRNQNKLRTTSANVICQKSYSENSKKHIKIEKSYRQMGKEGLTI